MQSSSQIMIKTNINCRDRRGNCYNNKQKQSPRGLLEISEDVQENTCARVCFLIKLQVPPEPPTTLLKKRLWHRYYHRHEYTIKVLIKGTIEMQSSCQIMIKTHKNCRDRRDNYYNNKQKQSPGGVP